MLNSGLIIRLFASCTHFTHSQICRHYPTNYNEQEAHQLVGEAKHCATKIQSEAVGGGIFYVFFS